MTTTRTARTKPALRVKAVRTPKLAPRVLRTRPWLGHGARGRGRRRRRPGKAPRLKGGWRTLKTTLDLRPVYHRLEERIRAHIILCWLALLLVRIVETTTTQTWHHLR